MTTIAARLKRLIKSLPWIRPILAERDALRARVAELASHLDRSAEDNVPKTISEAMLRTRGLSLRTGQKQMVASRRFENAGYCCCCQQPVKFVAYGNWWRDQYLCSNCGCLPRERAIMYCIDSLFPGWQGSKIHESSPGKRGASMRLKAECRGYLPTQYYPGVTPGTVHDGFRCENLEALTFKDESIDLHVTQDVFEHVLAPEKAFGEIARTLKPGGAHVFTTPLVNKDRPSLPRARRGKGDAIEHLVPKPEYHGNPISAEGSLVTMHWGYDICDHIYRASGLFTTIVLIDAVELGIRADLIEVLITRKPWTVRAD